MHHHHFAGFGPAQRSARHAFWRNGPGRRPKYNVPMNIIETEDKYEVHLYATGFPKESIKVRVVEDTLLISGTRTIDEENLPDFIHQEFPIKSFERAVKLRGKVDASDVSARLDDGIVKIVLTKSAQAKGEGQYIVVA